MLVSEMRSPTDVLWLTLYSERKERKRKYHEELLHSLCAFGVLKLAKLKGARLRGHTLEENKKNMDKQIKTEPAYL